MDLLKVLLAKIRCFELVGILLSNGDFLAMNGVSGTANKREGIRLNPRS